MQRLHYLILTLTLSLTVTLSTRRNELKVRGSTFLALKSKIGRFGEHFHDGHYSFVNFLFAVFSTHSPHSQPFIKVDGHVPRAL